MTYYKIVSNKLYHVDGGRFSYENINCLTRNKSGNYNRVEMIHNSLFTARELLKFYGISKEDIPKYNFLQPVEISKNKTHFFFGLRFEDNTPAFYDKNGSPLI